MTVPPPCYGCGLVDAESTCTLASPFTDLTFDYSHKSKEIAKNVVEKGLSSLATLNEALQSLQKHRDQLYRIVVRHQNYLPPIARLSDDILLLVFQEVVLSNGAMVSDGEIWDLSAVCARWRSLALSCSSLWTRIELELGPTSAAGVDEAHALLQCRRALLQLDRASGQPLAVFINLYRVETNTYHHTTIPEHVRHIVSQLHRCQSIIMSGSGPLPWDVFASATPTFKFLRSLQWFNDPNAHIDWRIPSFFGDVPVLSELFIAASQNCHATAPELIELLCFTENLVKLSMQVMVPTEYMADATLVMPPVTKTAALSKLAELEVSFWWPWASEFTPERNTLWTALHHIRCPNVSIISISGPSAQNSDIAAVNACVLSSDNPSSIQSIVFKDLVDEHIDESIVSLISRLTSLRHLAIEVDKESGIGYESVLTALQWPVSNDADRSEALPEDDETKEEPVGLCPQLSRIRLVGWVLDSRVLRDAVANRTSNSALRHVITQDLAFTDAPPPSGHHLEWLEEMKCNGLLDAVDIIESEP